ncbi:MAG: TRAP transporter substrate-binding protein DctP, partial [Bradyrhizobium sp.]
GEIVPGLQVVDAVQNETVECGHTASYYYVGKDPTFAFDSAVPFGLNTRQHIAWLHFGGGSEMLNDLLKSYNVTAIPTGSTGAQMGGWFRKEMKSIDDFKGLKFRVGGFAGTIIAKVGGVPQQIAGGDIYPALEKGTIDAAEWVGPYDDEKLGFVRVAPYYYYPGWWEGGTMVHNIFNLQRWNELPKSYQAVLVNASAYANTWMQARYDVQNPGGLKKLIASGAQLRPFTPEVLEACLKATNELWVEISAKNDDFKKFIGQMQAFRNDEYLWWQVAEYTYDTFMIRSRPRG